MKHIPPPGGTSEGVLQLLIANLDYSDYLGRLGIGRIFSGTRDASATTVAVAKRDGSTADRRRSRSSTRSTA